MVVCWKNKHSKWVKYLLFQMDFLYEWLNWQHSHLGQALWLVQANDCLSCTHALHFKLVQRWIRVCLFLLCGSGQSNSRAPPPKSWHRVSLHPNPKRNVTLSHELWIATASPAYLFPQVVLLESHRSPLCQCTKRGQSLWSTNVNDKIMCPPVRKILRQIVWYCLWHIWFHWISNVGYRSTSSQTLKPAACTHFQVDCDFERAKCLQVCVCKVL